MSMQPTTKNLLRYNRRQSLREQKAVHEKLYRDPHNDDKGAQIKSIRNIDKMLSEQAPSGELTGAERDANWKRIKELETSIQDGMLTVEEMRRAPNQQTDAVYRHMKWEAAKKSDILEWKNRMIQQEPDSDDPNLANIEKLRPEKGTQYSGFMVDAMGPRGHMSFQNPAAQEGFDRIFPDGPKVDTALKQAQRVAEEKKGMSEEARKAASDRMKAQWEAKRAKGSKAATHEAVAV